MSKVDYRGGKNVTASIRRAERLARFFTQRLLYAWYFGDIEMILSNYLLQSLDCYIVVQSSTKIVMIAPYLGAIRTRIS